MFIKSVVALAVASVAAAQAATNYIQFTNPVGTANSYTVGQNTTFSWTNPCVAPYTKTSPTPTKVDVQLLDATNSSASFFLTTVTTIDCSGANGLTQGNNYWVVPTNYADPSKMYALSIVVSPVAYSGTFKILPAGGVAPTGSASAPAPKPTSAAAAIAAPILSAAAVVASAAYMLL